jgi:capsular exopolysaccharide synthesis family protein
MVIPSVEPDTQLMSLLDQINFAQQKLLSLSADIKPGHPTYDSADAMVKYLDKKINERVEGLMTALEQRVTSSKAVVDSRKAHLETAKATDIKRATETRPYYEAKQKLERLQKFSSILEYKIATTSIDEKLPRLTVVSIIEPARADSTPVRPKKTLNIILGIVIGLVVGIGLAFFIEYLDTSVKTIDDVERALQAPVLGVIPQNVGLLLNEGAESPHAEAYRVLRTNLLFSRKDEKLNTVCVVSAGAGEGKSTTILNLATVFAQSGQRVLLVDSDLRRPTLHKMLKVSNNLGLTNCLLKQNSLEEVIQTTSLPMLDILPSGKLPSSSLGILSSAQMRDLITELKRRYDFVLFDSPPIMGVSDASILASEVDMTIQVIQYRRYPQPMNIRAKQMVEKVGGNLVGIVLNNINMSQDESYYYYSGYYHGYYYSRDEEQVVPAGKTEGRVGEKPAEIKQKY